ncbi:MAG: ABC transporter permease [Clostridiales Family XIII bacterium]|nr:ABC transporter permease [Clostridiales Family XIII bacterium]
MSNNAIRRIITVGLVTALALVFALSTDSFLTTRNLFLLLRESAYTGLIALGIAVVIIGGGIDLSAGGIVCLVGVIAARASFIPGIPGFAVVLLAVLGGMVCGLLNGLIITRLHLSEFVTTLATGFVFNGLALLTTFHEGSRIVSIPITNYSYLLFGGRIGGLYAISVFWVVLAVFMQILLTRTRFGLHTCALGANPRSAQMSGIAGAKVKLAGFLICGAFCGLASALVVAFQTSNTLKLGNMMEFNAIVACVVGGVLMTGGKGDAFAAFFGALFMTLVTNGLYKWGLSTGALQVMYGAVIVIMTNFDAQFGRLTDRLADRRTDRRTGKGA